MLRTYRMAEWTLGQVASEHGPEWWQEWVQIQLDQLVPLFYQGRVPETMDIIEWVQPFVEQHATAAQRAHFFTDVALSNLRRDRFLVAEETLSACQAALAASEESGRAGEIGSARFWLGFAHVLRGDLEAAQEQLQAALHLGEQIGDATQQVRCLAFLAITARRGGQVETVQRLSERGLALVSTIQFPGILPHFPASLSWVAWRRGDLAQALKQAQIALELGQPQHLFPFQWTALLPLVGVALAEARDADAVASVRLLLSPTQQRLPHALDTALEAVVQAWDAGQSEKVHSQLQQAVALAMELGYL
jgi:tetratricopeptide (TPR) repeat protein